MDTTVQVQQPNLAELLPQDGAASGSSTTGHSPPTAFLYEVDHLGVGSAPRRIIPSQKLPYILGG